MKSAGWPIDPAFSRNPKPPASAGRVFKQRRILQYLSALRSNRLEPLSGKRAGQHSIRINRQWRIYFRCKDDAPYDVEIVD